MQRKQNTTVNTMMNTKLTAEEMFRADPSLYVNCGPKIIEYIRQLEADKQELLDRLIERCADYTTHAAKELDKLRAYKADAERLALTLSRVDWAHPNRIKVLADEALAAHEEMNKKIVIAHNPIVVKPE